MTALVPLSEKEGTHILDKMPDYAIRLKYKWTEDVAAKLKSLFLSAYKGCLTCPEYELRELPDPNFAYETIMTPVLGYLWLVRGFANFGNEIFRTVIFPVSNMGVVHDMVTHKDKKFRKEVRGVAEGAEWVHKWDLVKGIIRTFVSCHRHELYKHNLNCEFLPHYMRLWEYRCRMAKRYMRTDLYGAVLWGIGIKGAGFLPDHRVFVRAKV